MRAAFLGDWASFGLVVGLGAASGCGLVFDDDPNHCHNNLTACAAGLVCDPCTPTTEAPTGCVAPGQARCPSTTGNTEVEPTTATGPATSTGPEPGTLTEVDVDTTASTTTEVDTSSDSGPPLGCVEQGNVCVPVAPEGFTGPVALFTEPNQGDAMECTGVFSTLSTEAYSEFSGPDATCPCDCGPLVGAACGGAEVSHHGGGLCLGPPSGTVPLIAGCNPIGGGGWAISGSFRFDAARVIAGGCAIQASVQLDPARFATRHVACGGTPEGLDCAADTVCVPPPGGELAPQLCVWREGDEPCDDASVYSSRTVLHRSVTDERGCEDCQCATPSGPCTGTSAALAVAADCMGSSAGTLSPDGCATGVGVSPALAISHNVGTPPSSSCTPNTPLPTGEALPADAITVCCIR